MVPVNLILIQEPAFAALIQGKLAEVFHKNLEGTFSFDLHAGGGGMIRAISILNGFIESGKICHGMVVAGDAEPVKGKAGALMLGKGALNEGFLYFSQETHSQYLDDFDSYSNYLDNQLKTVINQKDNYLDHCIVCVQKSVKTFLKKSNLKAEEIELYIPSQNPYGFASGLADIFGRRRVVVLKGEKACYSAGAIQALALSQLNNSFTLARKVIFITVGPGITVDLAFYINPE